MTVSIITPTVRWRERLLLEAMASVAAQTVDVQHHIVPDPGIGPAKCRAMVLDEVTDDLVGFLDDDDLMDPDHVELLVRTLEEDDADLAFSWYRREGDAPETPRVHEWSDYALGVMLGGRNLIPVTVVAKRDAIIDAGSFRERDRFEDYSLWMRMLENRCRFAVFPHETWTYRQGGGNRTWQA